MHFALRIAAIICLCLCTGLAINPSAHKKSESITIMDNKKQYHAYDKTDSPIMLTLNRTTFIQPEFATAMASFWDVARKAYTPVEMTFVRSNPSVVQTDQHFQPLQPLLSNGYNSVDWQAAEAIIQEMLKGLFIFDTASWPEQVIKNFAQDSCTYITAHDEKSGALLGLITFLARASYPAHTIKAMIFAVDPAYHNRGIGKILMSSIFKLYPLLERIFLCTRVTNSHALQAYAAWGFTHDKSPIFDHTFNLDHWTFMDYKTAQCDILQKVAATLES